MKVTNKSQPEVYNLEVSLTAEELKQVMVVLSNAPNRTRYYHPAGDALYNALNQAIGNTEIELSKPFKPEPYPLENRYDYGYYSPRSSW